VTQKGNSIGRSVCDLLASCAKDAQEVGDASSSK